VSEPTGGRGLHAPAGLGVARQALLMWVREAGAVGREFLQAHLRALGGGGYSVRHVDDRAVPAEQLERITDPFRARVVAQTTAEGAHRPLKTAPDLRRGWLFEPLDERGLWTVLDYLYPACVGHWHAGREGSLRVTHWSDTAARQSGMYSAVRLLSPEAVRNTVVACCGDSVCLRRVAWGLGEDAPEPLPSELLDADELPAGEPEAVVPCPEACSIFISFAKVVLGIERSARAPVEGLGLVNEPELEQIRSLVAAAANGPIEHPREGEFDQPLNRRRLRYLALRLDDVDDASPPPTRAPKPAT
jgi:hypothetical protein